MTLTVLENFIPWVESDVEAGKVDRAWDTVTLLEQMSTREEARARDVLDGRAVDFTVPRYETSELEISHAQTIGTRRFPDGRSERGPVVFTGYGHFGQVKRDIEKLPGYGCNIIQIEFGPNSVLPNEREISDRSINEFLAVCDRAAKANVSVILLLSPHYFPQWALDKWPYLKDCQGGFFKYCVHDPNARAVIEKSLRQVISRIKDHPALHSVCLSNEPICVDLSKCRVTAKQWPAWLERRHGSIDTLNTRWGDVLRGLCVDSRAETGIRSHARVPRFSPVQLRDVCRLSLVDGGRGPLDGAGHAGTRQDHDGRPFLENVARILVGRPGSVRGAQPV